MSHLIGLVGFIGAGKGTVGTLLSTEYGYTQDSFAKPLKDAVATIFGWDRQSLEGDSHASREWRERPDAFWTEHFGRTFTPRLALQLMGTEAGRNVFHPDLWVISLLNRSQGKNVVITDVRFKNEVAAVHNADGLVIRVRRGIDPLWYATAVLANGGDCAAIDRMNELGIHQSEWDWVGQPVDYIIDNDGTFEDLRKKVSWVLLVLQSEHLYLTNIST